VLARVRTSSLLRVRACFMPTRVRTPSTPVRERERERERDREKGRERGRDREKEREGVRERERERERERKRKKREKERESINFWHLGTFGLSSLQ
jgi:hypothetical protein